MNHPVYVRYLICMMIPSNRGAGAVADSRFAARLTIVITDGATTKANSRAFRLPFDTISGYKGYRLFGG